LKDIRRTVDEDPFRSFVIQKVPRARYLSK
jgi:hypothetical protein